MAVAEKAAQKQAQPKETTNPYESMIQRFDVAAKIIGLDEETYNNLKTPQRQYVVSLPVAMDNGKVQVFEGYRIIHNTSRGPSQSRGCVGRRHRALCVRLEERVSR